MTVSFVETCVLYEMCLKAQQFSLALKFHQEQKKLWSEMPETERQKWISWAKALEQKDLEFPIEKVTLPFPVGKKVVEKLQKISDKFFK